jgi:hypothetical protein
MNRTGAACTPGDQVLVLVRAVACGGSSGISLDRQTAHL